MPPSGFPESPLEFGIFDWIESSDEPLHAILEGRLRVVEAADRLGYYGWHIAEHQGAPISVNASPPVVLAAASQRTRHLRLAALNFILPWYNPFRFYNDVCTLDHLSGGRLEVGVGRGVSRYESAFMGIDSEEESRARFAESLDIFKTAARSDVLDYDGRFWSFHDVMLTNHPYQQPWPPLWYPSNNRESLQTIAPHGFSTVMNGSPEMVRALLDEYRDLWRAHRDDADRHNGHVAAPKLGKNHHVYVAESDAEAAATAYPAYTVWRERHSYLARKYGRVGGRVLDPDAYESTAPMVHGSPQTVLDKLEPVVEKSSLNYLMLIFCFGSLTTEQSLRSLELFAAEVMPALRRSDARRRLAASTAVG